MTDKTDRSWRIPDHICVAETEYGAILLDQHSGRYYQLNPTAALVVEGLVGDAEPTVIAQRLARNFDVTAEQAGTDVADLTVTLERTGILERPGKPGRSRR